MKNNNLYIAVTHKKQRQPKLRLAATLAALMLGTIGLANPVEAKQFTDVPQNAWYHNVVDDLSNRGIINGYQDGTFKANQSISYAEYLTLLNNKLGQKQNPNTANPTQWYQNTFNFLQQKGVIENISNPNAKITRNEMARYLSLALEKLKGIKPNTQAPALNDYNQIPDNYKTYVANAVNQGIIKGDEHRNFNGNKELTRAEVAVVIKNLDKITGDTASAPQGKGWTVENATIKDPETLKMINSKAEHKIFKANPPKEGELTYDGFKYASLAEPGETVDLNNPNRKQRYQEGVIVKTRDGRTVTLKRGKSGVLGEGQGLDLYSGIGFKDGSFFKNGEMGEPSWETMGQPYFVNPHTGEGHFQEEWELIENSTKPTQRGTKDRELNPEKTWVWSEQGLSWLTVR